MFLANFYKQIIFHISYYFLRYIILNFKRISHRIIKINIVICEKSLVSEYKNWKFSLILWLDKISRFDNLTNKVLHYNI